MTPSCPKSPTYSRAGSFADALIGVEADIAKHEIRTSVAVDVTRGNAAPPAVRSGQSHLSGAIDEVSVFLVEHAHGHPFADDDEIELSISVVIRPCGGRHHAQQRITKHGDRDVEEVAMSIVL